MRAQYFAVWLALERHSFIHVTPVAKNQKKRHCLKTWRQATMASSRGSARAVDPFADSAKAQGGACRVGIAQSSLLLEVPEIGSS